MITLKLNDYSICLNKFKKHFGYFLEKHDYSSIVVLTDSGSYKHCWSIFSERTGLKNVDIIILEDGEKNKSIESAKIVWDKLIEYKADRNTLLINLGGGMVCDLGGFCAGTYMRGIDFIHVPTTLLAQVDASIGGKVAIDYNDYKNMIGLFKNPRHVFIDPEFLDTLSDRHYKNGFVEIIKHALIASPQLWALIRDGGLPDREVIFPFIEKSLKIKRQVVESDPLETKMRRILNFGHTAGHALETIKLNFDIDVLHGEAVAFGILAETYMSESLYDLNETVVREVEEVILPFCTKEVKISDVPELMECMKKDKKNADHKILFALIKDLGNAKFNCFLEDDQIKEALVRAINKIHNK